MIVGIEQRSGTNFVYDVLKQHRDARMPKSIFENFLTVGSQQLVQYARGVTRHYPEKWRERDVAVNEISRAIGDGLVAWLEADAGMQSDDTDGRLLTKSPGVYHLTDFFTIFPDAYLILLIRDGRAVVESGVKGIGFTYERWMRRWAEGAREMLRLLDRPLPLHAKVFLLRYEDLITDFDATVELLLDFCDLDPDGFDFDGARSLPVRGSSFSRSGEQDVHWQPIERPADFDPMSRAAEWSRNLHERFDWIAGPYLEPFGYERSAAPPTPASVVRNVVRDVQERVPTLGRLWGAILQGAR